MEVTLKDARGDMVRISYGMVWVSLKVASRAIYRNLRIHGLGQMQEFRLSSISYSESWHRRGEWNDPRQQPLSF